MNKSYIGTCGVLKNNSPSPDKIIHSDDIFKYENFNKNFGYPMSILWGTLLKCPQFNIGDKIKLIKYPDKKATVRKIYWHDKDKRIYYLLDVKNDKRKSVSRYYEDDNKFEKV